jgi:PAS domain S-box-containing protein
MFNYNNKSKKELIEELVLLKQQIEKSKTKENKLRESEKRFKILSETSPFAIIIYFQQNNSICYVNTEAEKLTGYSRKQLLGMSFWDIIHPENFKHIKERGLSKLISDTTPARLELQIQKRKGEIKWANFAVSKIEFDGEPAVIGTAFDITEKKEAELLIRESEMHFRSLYENAPVPYVSLTKKGIILYSNNCFTRELDYSKLESVHHWIGEFTKHNELKKVDLLIKTIIKNGHLSNFIIDLVNKNGDILSYSVVGNLIHDMIEKQSRIHLILYNITEQNNAIKALRSSEERYKHLVSKLPDLILVHINGNIVFANETTSNITGYTSKDLVNTSIFKYMDEENKNIVLENMKNRNNIGDFSPVYEIDIITKYNELRNAEIRATQIEYGGELASLAVVTDITNRKRMEDSLYESQRLIFTLMGNLPGMAYRCLNDAQWTMEFVSDGCKELTEYDPFDIISNSKYSYSEIIHPDDIGKDGRTIQKALKENRSFQTIYRIITSSGKIKWVWEKGRGVYYNKKLIFIEGFITDISPLKKTEDALKKSKERFSMMAENVQDGLTIFSSNKVVYMNRRAKEIFGRNVARSLLNFDIKKVNNGEKEKIERIKEILDCRQNGPEYYEYWIKGKDGRSRFIRNGYTTGKTTPEESLCYVVTSDLTERKIKEDEIKDKEERLRSLINDAPLGIIYSDLSGNIEYVNPQMVLLLGSPSVEETKTINLLTFPLLIKYGISNKIAECIKTDCKVKHETYYQSKWGKEVYISLKISPIRNYNEKTTGVIIIADDITEQKNSESLLKRSEQKNRAIFDAIPDIIFRLTADGVFIDYKATDLNRLLLPPEEFIGKSVFHVLPRKLAKTTMLNIKKTIQTGEVQNFDYDLTLNNKLNYFELRLIKSGEEEVLAIIRDITDKKFAEKEIEQLNSELIEKNKEQEQIIFVASHDLRSPLVNIQGFTKELEKTFDLIKSVVYLEERANVVRERLSKLFETDIPDSFNYIYNSTSKMDFLIAGLLKISRLGKTTLSRKQIDMNQLMQLVLSIFEFQVKEKEITITVQDLPDCYADEMMINQVFSNLLDNAIKYLSPQRKGIINIKGYIENENTVYCVEDNGIGIQSNFYNKIFELFHQLNTDQKGDGLGLAIARKIIEKHNGKIWVKSKERNGSCFFVSLPCKKLE